MVVMFNGSLNFSSIQYLVSHIESKIKQDPFDLNVRIYLHDIVVDDGKNILLDYLSYIQDVRNVTLVLSGVFNSSDLIVELSKIATIRLLEGIHTHVYNAQGLVELLKSQNTN